MRVGGVFPLCSIIRNARIIYARSTTAFDQAFDKWYRNIAYGKELCSKWKTDIRTDLCESCRAWTRVCNGTGTEFGACSWTEVQAQVHNSFDNWLRMLRKNVPIAIICS